MGIAVELTESFGSKHTMRVWSIFTVQEARQQKGELSELHHFRTYELLRSRWPRGHGSRCFPTGVFPAPALGFLGPRLPLTTPEPAPRLRIGSSRFFSLFEFSSFFDDKFGSFQI